MKRCVLNVATGRYVRGQRRLVGMLRDEVSMVWSNQYPPDSPIHEQVPYGFKAFAIEHARICGYEVILWADASIKPIRDLSSLWDLISAQGYWFSRNGWKNGQWCSDAALPLFGMTRAEAFAQEHVVATAFGLDLRCDIGREFAAEYLRFAKNGSFCGPWWNANHPVYGKYAGAVPCGPPDVCGHRHDQTAASVIAHRLGMTLTDPPTWFAYAGGEAGDTLLVADGAY